MPFSRTTTTPLQEHAHSDVSSGFILWWLLSKFWYLVNFLEMLYGGWAIVIVHCFFGSLLQIWSFRNRLVCYFCMLPARLEEEGGQEKRKEKKEKERRGKKNARDEGKMTQKKEKKVEEGEKPRGIAKSPIS